LFGRAEQWAREQGCQAMVGPINFTTYSDYRLLVAGDPKQPPFPGEPYNPPYYPELIEKCGYESFLQYVSDITYRSSGLKQIEAAKPILDMAQEAGYRFEKLTHQKPVRIHHACFLPLMTAWLDFS
jgi:hypothetical protein